MMLFRKFAEIKAAAIHVSPSRCTIDHKPKESQQLTEGVTTIN